ncbi:Cobalt-zinc-cadmium resistance protein CzcB [Planctomycetes bacterium Pan216]|uniref:Cobalt-zinc-cadmium resistance protein CzcB n=1 Tax=Kolteria novifilia TaxID=2527975 RepID=A0A518AYW4_9BACT|nr:Cobalt-zinc-cadmium resistance protein CzcB [Planctomycetes bacterium Pan216]
MSQELLEHPASNPSLRRDDVNGSACPPLSSGRHSLGEWLLDSLPTVVVLACLGAVGYLGHRTGWSMPKFSTLLGTSTTEPDDWCEEHGVAESQCVACRVGLFQRGPDHGWCATHGVHNCPLDHPEVAQRKSGDPVTQADLDRAARALAWSHRKRNNAACTTYLSRIQFASIETVQQAGVDVELVERGPIVESVAGNGEIVYDPTMLAKLSSPVPGSVWRVEKSIGDSVQKGELLALVDGVEVGKTKSRLVQALVDEKLQHRHVERLKAAREAIADRQILEAEAALAKATAVVLSAEQALVNLGLPADAERLRGLSEQEVMDDLRFLGISKETQKRLGQDVMTANLLPIRSPMDGVIVDRRVVTGEVVDSSHVLFRVADTNRMWLVVNVPMEHATKLSPGQTVRFRPGGSREEVTGTLDWISTAVDPQTRMLKVRAELDNTKGTLRDETFGSGQIILREEEEAIVVPNNAIHWEGCCQVVFVRDRGYFDSPSSPKVFHVRTVRLGATNGNSTEVIAGLLPGEVVATSGSDVLRAQLLKNNLGEGCCVDE